MNTQSVNSILVQKANTTQAEVVARILAVFDRANPTDLEEGSKWYEQAHIFALEQAKEFDFDVELVATVIAHLSPRVHWSRNKKMATSVLAGDPINGIMKNGLKNCIKAFATDNPLSTLNGPKVKAFAANILGDEQKVTIDVHAAHIALGDDEPYELYLGRKGVYDALAVCYKIAAARRGVSPATMQAVAWIIQRNHRFN